MADTRENFEKYIEEAGMGAGLSRDGDSYYSREIHNLWCCYRTARASRPAEVDDEGLPVLPKETAWMVPISGLYEYFATKHAAKEERAQYEASIGNDADNEEPEALFTAEQFRQGQRDAVVADRARRGNDQQPAAWALVSPKGGIKKVSITRGSVESRMKRWLEEWPDNKPVIRPLVFGDSAPSHTTNKEKD